ncbi:MAG: acetyltransferase [Rhodoferax sp. RIFCSPLOWO2_12_FULL_60_11]|nr:MAG: acetyltransferase [Rhodoferax sp. RIFCSPLOWO2_12_FULL_60_11]
MALRLAHLSSLRTMIITVVRLIYVRLFKMDLHPTCNFSLSAKFDKTNPRGVHVGEYSYVAFDAAILTHDLTRGLRVHTRIGKNCFVGARSIVLPGVLVGDGSIIGAGSVVVRDVPAHCIVAGNPAKVVREGIATGRYGRLSDADETQTRQSRENNLD